MMTELVEESRKNVFANIIIRLGCWIMLKLIDFRWEVLAWFRSMGFASSKYKKIKKLKNVHSGEKCFIICTGPSLTIHDLELLKGQYTFAMNSIVLLYEKTDFRPTFYGCIDEKVWLKLRNTIKQYDTPTRLMFVSNRQTRHDKLRKHWYEIPVNVAYHTYDRYFRGKFWCKMSDDAYRGVYDMYSVTQFLIQIAIYMGFKEIYLLGADCNFPKNGPIHFKDYGVADTTIDTAGERNICGYKKIKEYCDSYDVKVYNATRGGALEVFDRIELEDALA